MHTADRTRSTQQSTECARRTMCECGGDGGGGMVTLTGWYVYAAAITLHNDIGRIRSVETFIRTVVHQNVYATHNGKENRSI